MADHGNNFCRECGKDKYSPDCHCATDTPAPAERERDGSDKEADTAGIAELDSDAINAACRVIEVLGDPPFDVGLFSKQDKDKIKDCISKSITIIYHALDYLGAVYR